MNTLIKRLPLLGFVLAAVFAFAFTKPVDPMSPKFGMDSQGRLYDVTGINPGGGPNQYQCDETNITCTYADQELSVPLDSDGQFIPGAGLQPIGE